MTRGQANDKGTFRLSSFCNANNTMFVGVINVICRGGQCLSVGAVFDRPLLRETTGLPYRPDMSDYRSPLRPRYGGDYRSPLRPDMAVTTGLPYKCVLYE